VDVFGVGTTDVSNVVELASQAVNETPEVIAEDVAATLDGVDEDIVELLGEEEE